MHLQATAGTVWIVQHNQIVHSIVISWNTSWEAIFGKIYPCFSIDYISWPDCLMCITKEFLYYLPVGLHLHDDCFGSQVYQFTYSFCLIIFICLCMQHHKNVNIFGFSSWQLKYWFIKLLCHIWITLSTNLDSFDDYSSLFIFHVLNYFNHCLLLEHSLAIFLMKFNCRLKLHMYNIYIYTYTP